MHGRLLTPFWIVPSNPSAPIGFGITAHSLDNAIAIIKNAGYGDFLPDDLTFLKIIENVHLDELDQVNVRPSMGPIVVRGMWYPYRKVGL